MEQWKFRWMLLLTQTKMDVDVNVDWFEETKWNSISAEHRCPYVEDLCHMSSHWFYRSDPSKQQPKIEFEFDELHYAYNELSVPKKIITESTIPHNLTCTTSPIPNHMILFSFFTKMLGEVYARVVLHLYTLFEKLDAVGIDLAQIREQTQLYIARDRQHSLLDSQHMFLDPFLSNPLLDAQYLFHSSGCRCMKRVFFCGYKTKFNPEANTTVFTQKATGQLTSKPVEDWAQTRAFLRKEVLQSNPFLQDKLQDVRDYYCTQHLKLRIEGKRQKAKAKLCPDDFRQDWKIVGFAQRTLRRKWIDLDRLIPECNRKFNPHKILCVLVNIEQPPFHDSIGHVLSHAPLAAIIGIHGAQLTDALWMEDESLIVELLPWVPKGQSGKWTRQTHVPTPLGVIYHNTPLNHIGVPLPKESAPQCAGTNQTHPCTVSWGDRDFWVSWEVIFDVMEQFVQSTPETCQEFRQAVGDQYVAYNVYCKPTAESNQKSSHHYYRSKKWLNEVTELY